MEAIGLFSANDQPVVSILASTSPDKANGAVSFAPTEIRALCEALRVAVPVDDFTYTLGGILSELPMITWV